MKKCKIQGKYAGTVEDIHKGTVFVRLSIGVNAIAHSCYDSRTVGKKDQVSFVVTHIDEERNVALGIITRITSRPYKASTLFLNSFFSYTAPISPANTHDTAT